LEPKSFSISKNDEQVEGIVETTTTAPAESVLTMMEGYDTRNEFVIVMNKDVLDQACWAHAGNAEEHGKKVDEEEKHDVVIDVDAVTGPWTSLSLILEPLNGMHSHGHGMR
jgi:hypothetical protein